MTVGELEIGLSVDGADSAESATASLGDAIQEMTRAVSALAEEFTDFESNLERAESATDLASESIRDVGTASEQAASAQNEMQQELGETAQAADRAADAQQELSGSTGQATNVVTGFGDAVQDAAVAGPAAAANNLSFIVEGFGDIVSSAGSATGALKTVGKSLLGPAGIVLGIQLAVSVLPPLIDALTEAGGVSEGLSASLAALGAAILPVQDELRALGSAIKSGLIAAFDTALVKNALRNVVTILTGAFKTIGQVVELALNIITLDFDDAWSDVQEIVKTVFQSIVRVVGRGVDSVLAGLQTLASGVDSLFGTSFAGGAEAARASTKQFFDGFTTDLQETEKQVIGTASTIASALGNLGGGGGGGGEDGPRVERPTIEQPESPTISPDVSFDEQLLSGASVEQVTEALEVGLVQSSSQADAALSSLKEQFNQATSDEQRQRIQALITRVERLKQGFKSFKTLGQQASATLKKGISSLGSSLSSVVGGIVAGKKSFSDFGSAAKKAVKSIISQLAALAAKMAVLKALTSVLSISSGGFLGSVVSSLGGGAFLDSGASGGTVKQDGLAVIHEGEEIVPKETVGTLKSMLQPATPSVQPAAMGGGMNITVSVQGETRTDGRDLKTAYDQTTRVQRRKGRR